MCLKAEETGYQHSKIVMKTGPSSKKKENTSFFSPPSIQATNLLVGAAHIWGRSYSLSLLAYTSVIYRNTKNFTNLPCSFYSIQVDISQPSQVVFIILWIKSKLVARVHILIFSDPFLLLVSSKYYSFGHSMHSIPMDFVFLKYIKLLIPVTFVLDVSFAYNALVPVYVAWSFTLFGSKLKYLRCLFFK